MQWEQSIDHLCSQQMTKNPKRRRWLVYQNQLEMNLPEKKVIVEL